VLGCVSYQATSLPSFAAPEAGAPESTSHEQEGLSIALMPFLTPAVAKRYLGLDPVKAALVPIYLRVANTGVGPIRVDLQASVLLTDRGREVLWLPFDQAVERARPAEWGHVVLPHAVVKLAPALAGVGIAYGAGANAGNVNQEIEQDFLAKAFRPSVIPPGGTAAGLVFFSALGYQQKLLTEAVVPIEDLSSGQVTKLRLRLPARDEGAAPGSGRP
jgi:hypothetical protein